MSSEICNPALGLANPPQILLKSGLKAGRVRTVDDVNAYTLTTGDLQCGYITSASLTAAAAYTLPAIASMLSAGYVKGDTFSCVLNNGNAAGENITITAGDTTGVLYGPVLVAPSTTVNLRFLVTDASGNYNTYIEPALGSGGVANTGVCATSVASPITAAVALTAADSGGVFGITQDAGGFDIDLPAAQRGLRFLFVLTTASSANVTITVLAAASTFIGTVTDADADTAATLTGAGSTVTFPNAAVVGDSVEFIGISTALYLVRAFSSADAGITIS